MKTCVMLLLLLFVIHVHAADEHAGHTGTTVNTNVEPVAADGSSQTELHNHGAATTAAPAAHVHEVEPATAAASPAQEGAPHVHETATTPPPAAAHVHGATAEPATTANAAQEAPAHVHGTETAVVATSPASVDNSAAMQEARHMNMMMHGDTINTFILADRFELISIDGSDFLQWEMQGWVGRDLDKFWFKTEGAYDTDSNDSEETEVQALYSRAVAPFWDVQAGVRQNNGFGPSRTYAVLGVQVLAPYWFELDAAAFVSERGDLSTRLEAEYDLRFTQRMLLQPRLELNYAFADDAAVGAGKGLRDASFGLRLRYEIRREFAPYIGVEWRKAYRDTARYQNLRGDQRDSVNVVAGVRIWY